MTDEGNREKDRRTDMKISTIIETAYDYSRYKVIALTPKDTRQIKHAVIDNNAGKDSFLPATEPGQPVNSGRRRPNIIFLTAGHSPKQPDGIWRRGRSYSF